MYRVRKVFPVLMLICFPFFFLQCANQNEEVPFFDGLFLEYETGVRVMYTVNALDKDRFKIIKTEQWGTFGDKITELYVNMRGRVYKSNTRGYKGKFSPIWIPVHQIEVGESFDEGYTAIRKDRWKNWDVMVIKSTGTEEERYFELNKGFFVGLTGSFDRKYEPVLVNTNAGIISSQE
jgi:hypothetical protein